MFENLKKLLEKKKHVLTKKPKDQITAEAEFDNIGGANVMTLDA